MKRRRFGLLFFTLFYLIFTANVLFAQELYGTIKGTVTDSRGPVAQAKVSFRLKGTLDSRPLRTTTTDDNGNFTLIAVKRGVYDVKTEFSCVSLKTENVEVSSVNPVSLNVKLADENCAQKTAEDALEWQVCEQETSVAGLKISDSGKASLVNQVLEDLFNGETEFPVSQKKEIILSTENIDSASVKSFQNRQINFLNATEIQSQADKQGNFNYLAFHLKQGNTCAFVGVSNATAVKKGSEFFYCPVGSNISYLFRKEESGKWIRKQFKIY